MSPSVKSCCIKGCTEKSRRKLQVNSSVKFYCFPLSKYGASWKDDKLIKWINAVKNYVKNPKEWEPNEHTRICSAHFINNCKSENSHHPSYVPSIFPGIENTKKSIQRFQRFERSRIRQLNKEMDIDEPNLVVDMNSSVNSDNCIQDKSANYLTHIEMELDAEEMIPETNESCHKDASTMTVSPPGYRSITCQTEEFIPDITSDNCTYFFCNLDNRDGVSTAAVQVNISVKKTADKMCGTSMPSMKKKVRDSSCDPIKFESMQYHCNGFHGFSSITSNQVMSSLTGITLSMFLWLVNKLPDCKTTKVDKKTKLLITLIKLKTGLTFTAISVLFNIHRTTVNQIFINNLQHLNILLQNFIFWPSKHAVQATLPEAFKKHYPDTRVIIDCTEVYTEVPPAVKHRVLMYSDYKHHHTMKFLVGCTPSGFISFLSKCYGGRASDCFITNDCGLVDLIEPGDVVLADKGFPQIETKVKEKNAIFVMPPFCKKKQLTPEEVHETYNIASVRIRIERVNQRIKDFNILSKVPVSLLNHVDEIVFVICAIINLQNPLFKQDNSGTE